MSAIPLFFIPLYIFITAFPSPSKSQDLVATPTLAKLPYTLEHHAICYDGLDFVYIFGGRHVGYQNKILKYTLSNDSIEVVGMLPFISGYGAVASDGTGRMYYFGGHNMTASSSAIYVFDTTTHTVSHWGNLPEPHRHELSVVAMNSTDFVIIEDMILSYTSVISLHLPTQTFTELDGFPNGSRSGAVLMPPTTILGARNGWPQNPIFKYDPTTNNLTYFSHSFHIDQHPSIVFDGQDGWIVSGLWDLPSSGILKVDPVMESVSFVPVEGFPATNNVGFLNSAAVYVERLNRIYIFGGHSTFPGGRHTSHDDIWYINLNPLTTTETPITTTEPPITTTEPPITTTEPPITTTEPPITTPESPQSTTLNPDLFDCTTQPDGIHPHPTDCSKYIGCSFRETYVFDCPLPLLFDPVGLRCNFPHLVECNLSCSDKPDGVYSHPHDCSLYVICYDGSMEVFKCPQPLLFDPIRLDCNHPHLVVCDIVG